MSDYLGHLAARTLNRAQVIQPRLPGLFEPLSVKSAVGLRPGPLNESSAFQELESERIVLPNLLARSPHELQVPKAALSQSVQLPHKSTAPVEPQPSRIKDESPNQFRLDPSSERPATLPQPSPFRPARTSFQKPGRAALDPDSRPTTRDELSDSIRPSILSGRATSSDKPGELTRARSEPRPTQPAGRPASASIVVQPRVTAAQATELATQVASEPIPPAAPPTIRVTIGRVEVRAMLPPTPPARQTSRTAPSLSLDEYLRARRGGAE
jgi:hypothetical protein